MAYGWRSESPSPVGGALSAITSIDDPARHWKISEGDYAERRYWDDYTKAFEAALSRCSTAHASWFIIPANHKWFRNLAISRIIVDTFESFDMQFPEPSVDIEKIKRKYHAIIASEVDRTHIKENRIMAS